MSDFARRPEIIVEVTVMAVEFRLDRIDDLWPDCLPFPGAHPISMRSNWRMVGLGQ